MTDPNPVPTATVETGSDDKTVKEENSVSKDETQQPVEQISTENNPILETSNDVDQKEVEHESKEPSSERQYKDAEKSFDGEKEGDEEYVDNDSEYEDVDDDDEELQENDSSTIDKNTNEKTSDANDENMKIKPRRLPKNRKEDEHSEDENNQNVSQSQGNQKQRRDKKEEKEDEKLDDDNDVHNPAYVPRKGKFYEHDDRTNDQIDEPKAERAKNRNRQQSNLDGQWKHDLYFEYENPAEFNQANFRQKSSKRGGHSGFNRNDNRDQLHLNDYMPKPTRGRGGGGFRPKNNYYDEGNDYRRRTPGQNDRVRNEKSNNFGFEDYNRPASYNNRNRDGRNFQYTEEQPPRWQKQDFKQNQNDEHNVPPRRQQQSMQDQTFHRERNFTNSQYQQQRNPTKNSNQQDDNVGRNRNQYRETDEPPRRQGNNIRNQPRPNENMTPPSNLSVDAPSFERPKRYSNMRNNIPNSGQSPHQQQQQQHQQQQQPQQQQAPMQMQNYSDQRVGFYEQQNWQRGPPPSAAPPQQNAYVQQQQMMQAQMYHHQQQQISPQQYYLQHSFPQQTQYPSMNQ